MLSFYALFKRARNARVRCWTLGMMFLSTLLLWALIGASLIFCFTFLHTNPSEIREVFGSSILIAMVAAIPLSLIVRVMLPKIMLGKVKGLHLAHRDLEKSFTALARSMQITTPKLRLFRSNVPISFAVETGRPTVVMSDRLLSLLTPDEIKAVMAHEFAHIKNSDAIFKTLLTAYTTVLPLDPIMRMIEAAFHREREILADGAAAHATGKPRCLASALLKIHRIFPKNAVSSHGILSIFGIGPALTNRHPPVSDRINRLMRLAQNDYTKR